MSTEIYRGELMAAMQEAFDKWGIVPADCPVYATLDLARDSMIRADIVVPQSTLLGFLAHMQHLATNHGMPAPNCGPTGLILEESEQAAWPATHALFQKLDAYCVEHEEDPAMRVILMDTVRGVG